MRHIRNCCWARALAVLWLGGWIAPLAAAGDGETAPLKLEVGATQRNAVKLVPFVEDLEEAADAELAEPVQPQSRSTPIPLTVQFNHQAVAEPPQSADQGKALAQAQGAPPNDVRRLPATALSSQPEFQPHFRTPTVRQAQHLEPSNDDEATAARWQPEGTREQRRPAPRVATPRPATTTDSATVAPSGPTAAGKALIEEAYAKSKQATDDTDYTEIIDLCGRAGEAGLKTSHKDYAKRLMSWAYNRRGEARVAQGRDKEALADFEASAELNPDSWRAVHNRGVSYAAEGRTTEAIADFGRTIKLNPKYANAYFNRGELLYSQGKFSEAIDDYKTAIDLGPTDAAMFNSLGHAYYRTGSVGESLREYGRALELDPGYAQALVNRGDAYKDVGRYADAAADYRAAINAQPQFGRAYQAAAWLIASCPDQHYRNEQLAAEAAQKAIELDGENHLNLETLAAAQASAGRFDEAKETQEKAIAKVPSDQLLAAEKRMALYQREIAFREGSQQQLIAADGAHRQTEAENKEYPVQRAGAELPEGQPQRVVYPEIPPGYRQRPPAPESRRGLWSRLNPFDRPQQPAARQPRNLPKRPRLPSPQHNLGPW